MMISDMSLNYWSDENEVVMSEHKGERQKTDQMREEDTEGMLLRLHPQTPFLL